MIRLQGRTVLTTVLLASAVALSTPALAAPVITFLGYYTDRYAPNSVPNFATAVVGNHAQWDVQLISSDPANAVNVIATRPGGIQFNLFFQGSPIFANYLFSRRSVPFSEPGIARLCGFIAATGVLWPPIRPGRSPAFSRQSPIRSCSPLPPMYKLRIMAQHRRSHGRCPICRGLTSTVFACVPSMRRSGAQIFQTNLAADGDQLHVA